MAEKTRINEKRCLTPARVFQTSNRNPYISSHLNYKGSTAENQEGGTFYFMNKQYVYENMTLLGEATKDLKLSIGESHTLGYFSQDDPQTIKNLCSIVEKAKQHYQPNGDTHGVTWLVREHFEGGYRSDLIVRADADEIKVMLNSLSCKLVKSNYPITNLLEAVLDGILAAVSNDSDVSDILTSLKADLKS